MLAVIVCAYLAAVYMVWDANRFADAGDGGVLPAPGHGRWRSSPGVVAFAGIFVLHADAEYLFDNLLTGRGLPLVILSALCGIGSLVLLLRGEPPRRPSARDGRGGRP